MEISARHFDKVVALFDERLSVAFRQIITRWRRPFKDIAEWIVKL
jgi:hypothetical protein